MSAKEFEKLLHLDDEELIYLETYTAIPGSVFSRECIVRIFQLAGLDPPTGLPDFVKFTNPKVVPLLTMAIKERRKLVEVGKIMNS